MREAQVYSRVAPGLKICAMCGALNREKCEWCYNCSWHGEFDADKDHVLAALQELGAGLGFTEPDAAPCECHSAPSTTTPHSTILQAIRLSFSKLLSAIRR